MSGSHKVEEEDGVHTKENVKKSEKDVLPTSVEVKELRHNTLET